MDRFVIYPAIDLQRGQVVRLRQGDLADPIRYAVGPAHQAARLEAQGFAALHVVDLDGAAGGSGANVATVRAILGATRLAVQLGGGIRDMAAAAAWLEAGVRRIILGSAAVRSPDFVREACRAFRGRIVLGIDARAGEVATDGWARGSGIGTVELAQRFEDAGAAAIIFTDIERDGMLGGVNHAQTAALAAAVRIPVIASGGVAGVADVQALRAAGGIGGVVVGRALYDGRVSASQLLAAAAGRLRA